MKYVQEEHAKDLHRDLTRRFADRPVSTEFSIAGAGVHWNCTVKHGRNFCSIACFDDCGPEYLTFFKRDSEIIATGRTSSGPDTVDAVDAWLQGGDLVLIYDRFPFVDQRKRALASIRDELVAYSSILPEAATSDLHHQVCDLYDLWCRNADRSCQIFFYGKNEFPDATFYWDECELFRFEANDHKQLAAILKRWVCDRAMPSEMRKEFAGLTIDELADFYERGNPVEGEFIRSWDLLERFYAGVTFPFIPKVKNLIALIRTKGYDKTLRAGQSMCTMIVSRSRRHGLEEGQPRIAFSFRKDGMMNVHIDIGEQREITYPEIEFTAEIDALLKTLETTDIY